MAAFNYQWSSERMIHPSVAEIFDQMTAQLAELERKVDALGNQSIQNAYNQQQYNHTPNCYHPNWQDYPTYSWSNNHQDQFYAPSLSYPPPLPQPQEPKSNLEKLLIEGTKRMEEASEQMKEASEQMKEGSERIKMRITNQEIFVPSPLYPLEFSYQPQSYEISYQPPLQQEKKSNLEEILTSFIESTEMSIKRNEELRRDWEIRRGEMEIERGEMEIRREQLANIVNSCLHKILPSDIEINHKEEGEEQSKADIVKTGKEFQEADGRNLKRSYLDMEDDDEVEYKKRKIWEEEKKNKDDQALDLNGVKQILMVTPMAVMKQFQNSEEYYQVYIDQDKMNNLDEFKFGGGQQFCIDAMEIKEKTKRRHEMIIFVIEPD